MYNFAQSANDGNHKADIILSTSWLGGRYHKTMIPQRYLESMPWDLEKLNYCSAGAREKPPTLTNRGVSMRIAFKLCPGNRKYTHGPSLIVGSWLHLWRSGKRISLLWQTWKNDFINGYMIKRICSVPLLEIHRVILLVKLCWGITIPLQAFKIHCLLTNSRSLAPKKENEEKLCILLAWTWKASQCNMSCTLELEPWERFGFRGNFRAW